MSVNKNRPHVLVLPEDDANRMIANGFHLEVDPSRHRQMQVLPVAGGWCEALDIFKSQHVKKLDRNPMTSLVLLIDFDHEEDRSERAKNCIPQRLTDRVFVLGAWGEPEELKRDFGSYETIGSKMAADCRADSNVTWDHRFLRHNADELVRLREHVRPILFPPE